ncbi:hypothetical protein D3C83_306250 [compost metagenome]
MIGDVPDHVVVRIRVFEIGCVHCAGHDADAGRLVAGYVAVVDPLVRWAFTEFGRE